jgi:hypothetical protein
MFYFHSHSSSLLIEAFKIPILKKDKAGPSKKIRMGKLPVPDPVKNPIQASLSSPEHTPFPGKTLVFHLKPENCQKDSP